MTDPEPPGVDDALLACPNAIVAPHIASATFSTRDNMAVICANNLIAGLTGQAVTGVGESGRETPLRMGDEAPPSRLPRGIGSAELALPKPPSKSSPPGFHA